MSQRGSRREVSYSRLVLEARPSRHPGVECPCKGQEAWLLSSGLLLQTQHINPRLLGCLSVSLRPSPLGSIRSENGGETHHLPVGLSEAIKLPTGEHYLGIQTLFAPKEKLIRFSHILSAADNQDLNPLDLTLCLGTYKANCLSHISPHNTLVR